MALLALSDQPAAAEVTEGAELRMLHQEGTMDRAEPLTYSVDEVAELLGIARGVAYECVRNGSIPATRVGRRWLVPRKRFHAWLDGTETASTAGRGA